MTTKADGGVRLQRAGPVATIMFARPRTRNAMSWLMYEQQESVCAALRDDRSCRVVVLRGEGGQAFVAGTDVDQSVDIESGEDGLAHEERMEEVFSALEALTSRIVEHGPLTMSATKEALRRLRFADLPEGDDLVRWVFGSEDFKEGATAFLAERPARWEWR
jgi:enoyl-CoA hydratase/carnithine racemase